MKKNRMISTATVKNMEATRRAQFSAIPDLSMIATSVNYASDLVFINILVLSVLF